MEKLNYEQLMEWDKNDLVEHILNLQNQLK